MKKVENQLIEVTLKITIDQDKQVSKTDEQDVSNFITRYAQYYLIHVKSVEVESARYHDTEEENE